MAVQSTIAHVLQFSLRQGKIWLLLQQMCSQGLTILPTSSMHPNQLLKMNLEQVKVHIIAADKCNVDPNYPLYKYSAYTSYWIFAKNNIDSHIPRSRLPSEDKTT